MPAQRDRSPKGDTVLPLQTYLYTVEEKSGLTPRALLEVAKAKGLSSPDTKAAEVKSWLKSEYGLGPGHALLVFHLLRNERQGAAGADRREDLDALWLDGKASAPSS
jgi:hypothetical protein